jgi:hypothetical protein
MSDVDILPGGASPPPPNSSNPIAQTNKLPGFAVYAFGDDICEAADASAAAKSLVTGITLQAQAAGERVFTRFSGPVTLTDAEWAAALIGAPANGLTRGSQYYVSAATPGKLTTVKPANPNFVAPVGVAISASTLLVQLGGVVANGA